VLRYAGYCYDDFSGLYYCSQRYYDPATAQFITKDPAKADGEESAYQYCGGDPVGKVDPSGLYYAAGAVKYALAHVYAYQWNYKKYGGYPSDCTNFVSQCLYEGGRFAQDRSGYLVWWWQSWPSKHSNSWTVAHDLYAYLASSGRSKRVETYCASSKVLSYPKASVSAVKGDVVFYDWTGDGYYDHAAIVTGYSSAKGDRISQHTTNRKNVVWHLKPCKTGWTKVVFRVLRPL